MRKTEKLRFLFSIDNCELSHTLSPTEIHTDTLTFTRSQRRNEREKRGGGKKKKKIKEAVTPKIKLYH